jgi:hypothetical protein
MTHQEIQTAVCSLPGVTGANLWTKVPGKERLYIDTTKYNGGKNWNGGKGFSTCYIDLNTAKVVMDGEAGAATRNRHNELGTRDALETIAKNALKQDA